MRIRNSGLIGKPVLWTFAGPQFPLSVHDAIHDSFQTPEAVLHQLTVYERMPRRARR